MESYHSVTLQNTTWQLVYRFVQAGRQMVRVSFRGLPPKNISAY
jgi:hypothetical protein